MKKVFKVALKLYELSVPEKITKARQIADSMNGNAFYANPTPTLAELTAAANNLEATYLASRNAGPDETAAMYEQQSILDRLLTIEAAYVESIANLNPAKGEEIILSAGIDLKNSGKPTALGFKVENTDLKGNVKLRTLAVARASYIWEQAQVNDQEPVWQQKAVSLQSKIYINGLESGKRYQFRVATVSKEGQGDWSEPMSLLVA